MERTVGTNRTTLASKVSREEREGVVRAQLEEILRTTAPGELEGFIFVAKMRSPATPDEELFCSMVGAGSVLASCMEGLHNYFLTEVLPSIAAADCVRKGD